RLPRRRRSRSSSRSRPAPFRHGAPARSIRRRPSAPTRSRMLADDLRFAFRMFAKHPGTAAAAILSLTLGVGANAIIFTFVKDLFLPRLPIADASRVVIVYSTATTRAGELSQYLTSSFPNARDLEERNEVFSGASIVI